MNDLIAANWPIILVALLIGLVVAWFLFTANRKARVDLDTGDVLDDGSGPAARNQALIDAAPAAGVPVGAAAQAPPASSKPGDDLTRIKGVGPKLEDLLNTLGISRFDQIAAWSDADIAAIDARLGRFEGRITRDNWVKQARLLATGDTAAYEGQFGRL